jgi:4-amino-4-deoxy-L-arabinose transferase-like glycosyltransferase
VLLAAALLALLIGLGATDLWEPDEPRHGAIAEEMRALRHGPAQLVVPRLNGEVYTQKPPLYYWLAALMGLPAGRVSEGTARLPSALAGVGTALVAYRLGRLAFGGAAGLAGGAILLTTPAFVDLARSARPDALMTFFISAALLFAWRVDRGLGPVSRDRVLMHLAAGLGVLAKGPVAVLLPLLGLVTYLAWERRLGDLLRFVSAPALLASLGPGLLWIAGAVAVAPGGFFEEAVSTNVWQRFFEGTEHEQPFYFYLTEFPKTLLPWSVAWPFALWVAREHRAGASPVRASAVRFLLSFVAAGLVFFSLSKGKRDAYLLPLFPPVALLVGAALETWLRRRIALQKGWARAVPALAGVFALIIAGEIAYHVAYLPSLDGEHSVREAARVAARLAPPDTPIGLVRNGSLIGGVVYYGGRPVERIGSAKGLKRFLRAGGRTLVLEAGHLDEVESVVDAKVAFRQEVGGDELLVVVAPAAPPERR